MDLEVDLPVLSSLDLWGSVLAANEPAQLAPETGAAAELSDECGIVGQAPAERREELAGLDVAVQPFERPQSEQRVRGGATATARSIALDIGRTAWL